MLDRENGAGGLRPVTKPSPTYSSLWHDYFSETICLMVLFDDRAESPCIKFNEADLLGIPLRITISPRTLKENSVEVKWRAEKDAKILPLAGLTAAIKQMVSEKL